MAKQNSPQAGALPLAVFGILFLVGIVSWSIQLAEGTDALGVGSVITWGVYIAAFFLLTAVGSGMLILGSLGSLDILPSVQKWARALHIAAVACLVAAGFMILLDLGKPMRVFNMLIRPNFSSLFVWDFYFLAIAVILGLVCIFRKPGRRLLWITALAGLAVVLAEGCILTVSAGRPLWNSPLVPILFLVEGLVAALSVILIVKPGVSASRLPQILAGFLGLLLVFSIVESVTVTYMPASDAAASLSAMSGGVWHWIQLILCIIVPLLILLFRKNPALLRLAGILALIGVFIAKITLLLAGQTLSFTGTAASYCPTVIELGGLVGGLGLAIFLFLLGRRLLPAQA